MKKAYKALRKLIIILTGFPIVIVGLILIPLPGPGILVTLAGLFILAIEFEWAERHKQKAKGHLTRIIDKANAKVKERQKP